MGTELDRKERIVFFAIRHPGKTDREITEALDGKSKSQQAVNRACRELARIGKLKRETREDGLIGNYPVAALYVSADAERRNARGTSGAGTTREDRGALGEDQLKAHLERWLKANGWRARIAWGRERGVDIEAVGGDGERWLIEVKGCGSRSAMRVNYFIAVLGETLQRMDDTEARYSIALPDMPQFHGLWDRLPRLAKERTRISMLFVGADGRVRESH
ncbi:MAG: MarR family transcriptional regulator [Gammaproteobacteria bacterium]|nr:MarR family transcriptional regulator [Gammaproteobacteria bacterium]